MTLNQINNILNRVNLGIPGAWFELGFVTGVDGANAHAIRVNRTGPDNANPTAPHQQWPGRYWLIQSTDTEDQVLNTLLKAVLTYVEHETRELFTVDGHALYEPRH